MDDLKKIKDNRALGGATYSLEIITPEETKFKGPVVSVNVPTPDGEIGVLASHANLISLVSTGELLVMTEIKPFYFAVGEGFIKVGQNKAFILVDFAEKPEEIKMEEAAKLKMEIEEKLALKEKTGELDFDKLKTQLKMEITRLKVAKRNFQ